MPAKARRTNWNWWSGTITTIRRRRGSRAEMVKDDALLAVIGHYYPAAALATAKVFAMRRSLCLRNVRQPAFWGRTSGCSRSTFRMMSRAVHGRVHQGGAEKDNVLLIHNTDPFGTPP